MSGQHAHLTRVSETRRVSVQEFGALLESFDEVFYGLVNEKRSRDGWSHLETGRLPFSEVASNSVANIAHLEKVRP